jgi:hypothetical protein
VTMLPWSNSTLLVRTDFSDPGAWDTLRTTISTPDDDGFLANAVVVDDRAYRDLTAEQVRALLPEDHGQRLLAVADATTLRSTGLPLLVIDLTPGTGGEIRVVAREFWSIENNLSIANMDFAEFAAAVDADGVFRGF